VTSPLSLLFGVHAHQPASNFPEVMEQACSRCYRPFLQTLHGFPGFRFAAHFSGPLLDYLIEHHPADVALLAEMVARGQVELFGAGDTEPVLASIPARDRIGQLNRLSRKIEARFGRAPQGAWLTERAWEATVVPALADCGMRYVTVDDYHFFCTGRAASELDGYFTTEEDDRRLDLFPISEALRYRIPFAPAEETVAFLERLAEEGRTAAIYFDDLEKFGIWPETHEWVHGRGWLRRFIEGVLASSRIAPLTFREFHDRHRSRGVVYLPTTAYIEMNEWTLPAAAAGALGNLIRREKEQGVYETDKPFLRGGIWKNFLSRYPEANWMHKRMLALSQRLAALPEARGASAHGEELRSLLYDAQANDAYWHGLFGGLYLPHLRRGVFSALVRLEALLDRIAPRAAVLRSDMDQDGCDELFMHNEEVQAVIRLDGRASICELDSYKLGQNFGDTLRRHAEHYHQRIARGAAATEPAAGIASAHDRIAFKHDIAASELTPDTCARTLFADTWIPEAGASEPLALYAPATPEEESAPPDMRFRTNATDMLVAKRIALEPSGVRVEYRFEAAAPGRFLVELNIAMPSCDGFAGRVIHRGEVLGGLGQRRDLEGAETMTLDDRFMGGCVRLYFSPPARVEVGPHYTVSQSESGFERIMQSVQVTLAWPVGRGASEAAVRLEIRKDPEGTAAPHRA
jgi:hypothetical protein